LLNFKPACFLIIFSNYGLATSILPLINPSYPPKLGGISKVPETTTDVANK
jgi:hypothetical protein